MCTRSHTHTHTHTCARISAGHVHRCVVPFVMDGCGRGATDTWISGVGQANIWKAPHSLEILSHISRVTCSGERARGGISFYFFFFFSNMVQSRDTVHETCSISARWKGLSVYSPHTCHHLSLAHYFFAALSSQILALTLCEWLAVWWGGGAYLCLT